MKNVTSYVLYSMLIAVGLVARSDGQQNAPGAGPPSPQIALPAEQQAVQGPTPGLSGPGAVPNPRAGAANQLTDQNAVPSRNANPAPSPGVLRSNSGVQPLYENSATAGPRGIAIDAEPAAPATSPLAGAAQHRGQMGVWLVDSEGPGVRIGRITNGSAAARAGLQIGDVILEINGRDAASPDVVARFIRSIPVGQPATLAVWRDGQQREVQFTMEPSRESYQVGFRGDRDNATGGDVNARLTRLEQQLALVTDELQHLRQELSQFRGSGPPQDGVSAPPATNTSPAAIPGDAPANNTTGAPNAGKTDQGATTPGGAADDLFGPGTSNSK